jgi:hypothetical protein
MTPQETSFSYAVTPIKVAFQDLATISTKTNRERASETALIIDCNSSTSRIQNTIECALETFPKENIFVVGNGNSDSPTNNTNRVCLWLGVRHIWIPTSSKVTAQYVGIAAAHRFRYCLLMDDDVALPKDFPVLTDRIEAHERGGYPPVKCIGYAEDSQEDSPQMQSLEYQLPGLPQNFFGKVGDVGCAAFPHGAISLWERSLLEECFHRHPGYRMSPNWFLGVNLALVLQEKSVKRRGAGQEAFRGLY